ncbi:hypothetical protein BCR36DRAFT_371356 [Piromyces finnis]|uniref:Uncharacterized protein n=1 Tax=Piromyces finnis TaxID=1754191 RepID=A0A1Y1V7V9_9FUNG|nr:hypothetical protein BCR36DRAFT_371356 [Piromyces finnis]|eukprot:ORX48103.1 hypothetical protein BCR36DRAFT_371356 [Piromyces finnis]
MIMENEISQFYTCITQISNTNKNEQIIKKYSLPTQLSSSSFISCDSGKENDQKENENIFLNDNIKFNDKNECSELIIETQQKLQNLRLESFIKTFPFTMEEKNNYNYNTNHTDIINTKEKTNKRKLNSDTNIFNQENENNNRKKNSERNYEKISEITKKIKLSDNKDGNNNPNNYVHDSIQCEINSYKNYNSIKNIFEVDKDDETSDYKKLESNNNNNDNQCWGILQSINPKFQTFHLKESQLKKEYTIGRSKNCDIQ